MSLGAPKLVIELAAEADRAELRSVSSVSGATSLVELAEDATEAGLEFRINRLHHIPLPVIGLSHHSHIAIDSSHPSKRPFKKDRNPSKRPFKKDRNPSKRPFKKDRNPSKSL